MPKMTTLIRFFSLAALFSALVACGKGNDSAPLVDSTGKHPAGWIAQHGAAAQPSTTQCFECHGSLLDGGISKVSCMNPTARCHTSSPAVNPTGCVSCHGVVTGPTGNTAPNRANAHQKHLLLAGVTCATCHNAALANASLHANGIGDVTLATTFSAKTGTLGYNNITGTCSAVSCHGGTSPNWSNAGSINVATDCIKCHEQSQDALSAQQYNSFYSGSGSVSVIGANVSNLHQYHLLFSHTNPPNYPITCASCHDTTKLATNHFSNLASHEFDATAASTIGGVNTKVTAYTAIPSGTCATACHGVRNWNN